MASNLQQIAADLDISMSGQKGGIVLTDTTAVTGNFRKIYALADATFTTLTSDITKNGDSTASTGGDFGTLSAGMQIVGKITSIKLATGKVIAYK